MNDDHERAAGRDTLAGLRRETFPPSALEERTVRTLRAKGLLRHRRASWPAKLALAAAVALVFLTGFEVGRRVAAPSAAHTPAPPHTTSSDSVTTMVAWF